VGGAPTGFCIDLIRRAAARRGIRLEWVFRPAPSEDALRRNLVDLWPVITITAERQRFMHFSDPYLLHDHVLMVRAAAGYRQPQDLAHGSVAYFEMPINRRLIQSILPGVKLISLPAEVQALEAVCEGRAEAAFLDQSGGVTALLAGGPCASQPLRMIWVPSLRTELAIGSTFAAAGIADELRSEIETAERGSELEDLMARWGYDTPQEMETMNALLDARRQQRRLIAIAAGFAALTLLAILAVVRGVHQRNRIRREIEGRERAQIASREWERRFRDLLEGAPLAAVMVDAAGAISFCNDYALSLTGWSRDQVIGRPAGEFLDLEFLGKAAAATESRGAARALAVSEGAIRTAGGEWRKVQWSATVLRDAAGRPAGFAGLGEDITELRRLRAEAAQREGEERFRAIFQQAGVGVAQLDLNGVVLIANDRFHAVLGYMPGELSGRSFETFTSPEDVEGQRSHMAGLVSGEAAVASIEKRYIHKQGTMVWGRMSLSVLRGVDNRPRNFIAVVEDITERKQAEAALRESEERFRTMANTAPVMIWMSGPNGEYIFFNHSWLNFTGRTMEQEAGDGWTSGVHPDDLDTCREAHRAAFDARRPFQVEFRLRSADGEYRWIRDDGVPRFGSDSVLEGYIGCCIDITETRRAHEEAVARQKLESIGLLAGGIAHRFNNLLGGILVSAQLAMGELPEDSPVREDLSRIQEVGMSAAEIVRELLAYAGKDSAELEPLDLSRLVSEMQELLKLSISKQASLDVDLSPGLPAIRANASQMRQVVMSLVTNASEAIGREPGKIRVATSRAAPAGEGVRLEVSDTGCGMSEDVLRKVFDPYYTTKFPGRGLGLPAVQGIVRGHGGSIRITSAPGRGTRFEIVLPGLPSPLQAREAAPARTGQEAAPKGTVLVIEDESALRVTVSKILRKRGYSVLEAADGLAGIELFRANSREIRVVLLDLTLPRISGPAVLAELRRMRPDIRVIVTTAYTEDAVLDAFGREDTWRFIRKPYQTKDLLALIGEACARP
jgi:PAS domain S-box-containing protein